MANWQQQSAAQRAEFERKIKADEAEFEALARLRTQRIAAEEIRRINEAQCRWPEPAGRSRSGASGRPAAKSTSPSMTTEMRPTGARMADLKTRPVTTA